MRYVHWSAIVWPKLQKHLASLAENSNFAGTGHCDTSAVTPPLHDATASHSLTTRFVRANRFIGINSVELHTFQGMLQILSSSPLSSADLHEFMHKF